MQEGVLILLKIFKALRAESYPRSGKVGLYQKTAFESKDPPATADGPFVDIR